MDPSRKTRSPTSARRTRSRRSLREETKAWFDRIYLDEPTPHTTAAEGHDNLMLCLAMDRSAQKGVAIHLPVEPKDLEAER